MERTKERWDDTAVPSGSKMGRSRLSGYRYTTRSVMNMPAMQSLRNLTDPFIGTSDEHISLLTHLHPLFLPSPLRPPTTYSPTPTCVLISTPQTTALNDTLKSLSFTRKLALPVLGLVENMSGYACPCCGDISDIFSKGGGEKMAIEEKIGFLGRVPIDTKLVELLDEAVKGDMESGEDLKESQGFPLLDRYMATTSSKVWKDMTTTILEKLEDRKRIALEELEAGSESDDSGDSDES